MLGTFEEYNVNASNTYDGIVAIAVYCIDSLSKIR